LLSAARGYTGNDAGVTHLAALVCPVLALFGPTDPRVWAPPGAQVLRAPDGRLESLETATVLERSLSL
jgi:ADP-heptose:LPS heptosyltransferase